MDLKENEIKQNKFLTDKFAEIIKAMGADKLAVQYRTAPYDITTYQTTHVNGGAVLAPLQVYCAGIGAPSGNAGLLIVSGPPAGASAMVRPRVVTFGVSGAVKWLPPWPPQPTSAHTSASPPMTDAIR